jgi:hypothetical protein
MPLQILILTLAISILFILPSERCYGQEKDTLGCQVDSLVNRVESQIDPIELNLYILIKELENLASLAYQYKIRPISVDGGGGSYTKYRLPSPLISDHGIYSVYEYVNDTIYTSTGKSRYVEWDTRHININPDCVDFLAESKKGFGTIHARVDFAGRLRFISVSGKLKDKLILK